MEEFRGEQIIDQAVKAGVWVEDVRIDGITLHVSCLYDDFTVTLTPASLKRPIKHVKEKLAKGESFLALWKDRQQ